MGVIKINNIIYGSNNSADIIYKNTTVEEKLNSIPIFDPSDNINIEANQYDYLTYGHIIDVLNSSDTSKVLSANQGRVLSEKIDNIDLSHLEDGIAVNAENISNLDSDIELLNNSLNNEYISNCDVFEEIEKEVVKRGNMSTFCLSFGGELTNAPTSDWIWFSVIYKAARIIAFNKDSIAILHRNNGIYDGWKIINPTDITNLNNKVPFSFGVDANGNYGYIKAGADTVIPFNNIKTGEMWLRCCKNVTTHHNYTGGMTGCFYFNNLDFSDIDSFVFSYQIGTSTKNANPFTISNSSGYLVNVDPAGNISNQTVNVNNTTLPCTVQINVSYQGTNYLTIHSYKKHGVTYVL